MRDAIKINDSYPLMSVPDKHDCMRVSLYHQRGWRFSTRVRYFETLRQLMLAGFAILICTSLPAQVVQLHTPTGKGTATAIGETDTGEHLFVTAGHVFEPVASGRIKFKGRFHECENIQVDPDGEDLACFTIRGTTAQTLPLFRGSLPTGERVEVPGYGPGYQSGIEKIAVRYASLTSLQQVDQIDSQVIPGDSGCPVVYQRKTVGIVSAFVTLSPLETVMIPAAKIERMLTRCQWQCTPRGCYVRPRVRQPMIGIGIPVGPPEVYGEVVPEPQRLVPVPNERFTAGPQGQRGERGPQGPAGPPGRDGSGLDPKQVELIVVAWLEANRDQLRGEPGRDGERGLIGVPSEPELQAVIDTWVARNDDRIRSLIIEIVRQQLKDSGEAFDSSAIEKRLAAIEKRPLKVVITEDGKIKDQESYLPGEPVVFDLARLRAK